MLKFGFGMSAEGPRSACVNIMCFRVCWSRVAVPKPCFGADRALEMTCFPNELSSGEMSSRVVSPRGVLRRSDPKLYPGAVRLSDFGCDPMADGCLWDPGPTCRGVEVGCAESRGVSFPSTMLLPSLAPNEYSGSRFAVKLYSGEYSMQPGDSLPHCTAGFVRITSAFFTTERDSVPK